MAGKPQHDLQKAHRRRKNRESFLETVESIVVAFVLAFIFRAFIVEAFVIPTGSMGPTLYGQHAEFTCTDCGYRFAVSVNGRLSSRPICPNCGLTQAMPPQTPLYSGDRILVLKFLYDFAEPDRWDVIVFRNPNQPEENYIKRLVGLPGETVELVRGDVTINGQVIPKTESAQDALWMLVHDTRYLPTRSDWHRRWAAEKAWKLEGPGYVLARAPPSGKTAWLAYHHRNARGWRDNIRDYYAYNSGAGGWRFGQNVCTDLHLATCATAGSADAVLVVEMRAYEDRLRFVLPAKGSEARTEIRLNGQTIAWTEGGVLPVGREVRVEVANVDRTLQLLVDGDRVTTEHQTPVTRAGDPTYAPTALAPEAYNRYERPPDPNQPPPLAYDLRVGATGGLIHLAYLKVDRDVYYTNERLQGPTGMVPGHATEGNPFELRADEFFVCGDNSPKSSDARLWPLRRPVVPRRNLVGKAFFVYWPAAGTRWHIPLAPDPTGWRLVH